MFPASQALRAVAVCLLCALWPGLLQAAPTPGRARKRAPTAAPTEGEARRSPPAPPSAATPPEDPSAAFDSGAIAFGRGEFARAIAVLRPLIEPEIKLESEGQVVQTHRMLGVAHLFEGNPTLAREHFTRLLELRPDYRFDALLDPPRVVEFFNQLLKEHEDQIALLEEQRRKADQAAAEAQAEQRRRELLLANPGVIERRYARNSFLINFVPFGAGQFQNGQRIKGWGFLISETILGTASAGALVSNFALFGFRPLRKCKDPALSDCAGDQIDRTDENLSSRLTQVQMISGGLFIAVAAWGIVDALLNFQALEPLPAKRVPAPAAQGVGNAGLVPLLLPSGAAGGAALGAGLSWRF